MALSFSEADGDGEDSVALTLAQAMLALAVVAATALALHWLGSGSEQDKDVAKQNPESSHTQRPQDREMAQTATLKAKISHQDQETRTSKVIPDPPVPSSREQPGRDPEDSESPRGKDEGLAPSATPQPWAPKITSKVAPSKQSGDGSQPSCGPQNKAGASPGPGSLLIHFTPRLPETWSEGGFGVREQPALLVAASAGEKSGNGQDPVGQWHDVMPSPRTRSRVQGPGPDPFTLGTVVSVWDAIDAGSSFAPRDPVFGGLLPQALGTRVSTPGEIPTGPAPEEKWALAPGSFQDIASRRGGGEGQVFQGQSKPLALGPQPDPTAVQEKMDSQVAGRQPSPRGTGLSASCMPSPDVRTPAQGQAVTLDTEESWPWKERELLITSSFSQPPNALIRQLVSSDQGSTLPIRKETTEVVPAPRQVFTDPSPEGTSPDQDPHVSSTSPGSVPRAPVKSGGRAKKGPENNLTCTEGRGGEAQVHVSSSVIHESPGMSSSSSSVPFPRAHRTMGCPSSVTSPGAPLPLGSPSLPPSPKALGLMGSPSSESPARSQSLVLPSKAAGPTEFPSLPSPVASAPTRSPTSVPAPTESPSSTPAPKGSLSSKPTPKVSPSSAPEPKVSSSAAPVCQRSPSSVSMPSGSPSSASAPSGSLTSAPALSMSPSSDPVPSGSLSSVFVPSVSPSLAPVPLVSSTSSPAPSGPLTLAPIPSVSPSSDPVSSASPSSALVSSVSPSSAPTLSGPPTSAPSSTVSSSSDHVPTGASPSALLLTASPASVLIPPESLSSVVPPRTIVTTESVSSGPSSTGPPSSVHIPPTLPSSVPALSASPSEAFPSAPAATASLTMDLPSGALALPVRSAQGPSKIEDLTVPPGIDPAPGGQSARALHQSASSSWGNLISMVLRSHPFPSPEKPQGEAPQNSPGEGLGPTAAPPPSSKSGDLTQGANTVVMNPRAKVRDPSPSEWLETPGMTTANNSRGLNGVQVEEKRMDTTDPQSVAQGPSPPHEPLGHSGTVPERKQLEPVSPKEAMPDAQPAPQPRKRSICQMADSLSQKESLMAPSQRETPAGLVAPLTERQLQDSQLMAFLRRPGTWGTVEGRRKPSHPAKDLPSTVAALRRHLDLGSCVEALAFAQQHGELALAKEVYALMSDNFLLVLGDTPLYRQLSAGDRERILALRTTRGRAVLGVLLLPSAYGVSRSGLAGGSQATEIPTLPSVAESRTYLHMFEPGRNTWLPLTIVPEEAPLRGCGLCIMHNYLFLAGGIRGSGPGAICTNEVFCYNPLTDIWTQVRPMLQARAQLKLVALEGLLYAIGGECLYSMECYDPRTDHWTSRAPLPAGTFPVAHEAVACRGDIYVTGGHLFYRLLKYSPMQDCWAECPYSASHRRSSDMVALGGFLYRFDLLRGVGAAVMRYNTVTGSWSQAAPLPLPEPIPLRCAVLGNTIYCLNQQVTATFTVAEGTAQFDARELKPFPMGGKGVLCPFTLTLPALTPLQTPL